MQIETNDTTAEGLVGLLLGSIAYYGPSILSVYTLHDIDDVATVVFHIISAIIAITTMIDMGRKKFKKDKTPPKNER